MLKQQHALVLCVCFGVLFPLMACKASPPPRTGFLSDYGQLEEISSTEYRFVSRELAGYDGYIVDPVQVRIEEADARLTDEQRAEAAVYFRDQFEAALREAGFRLPEDAGVGVARIRLAMTDLQAARILLNIHPGSKLTGAGTGGAAMEGEIIDSVTGKQLAALVQSGRGSQFEIDTFSRLDDVKDVVDRWVEKTTATLVELRVQEHPEESGG